MTVKNSVSVRVKVTPSRSREYIQETKKNSFRISVREKPKEGKANERVRELIAIHFRVPVKNVRIIKGAQLSAKTLLIYAN